jgi:hypothetical protein
VVKVKLMTTMVPTQSAVAKVASAARMRMLPSKLSII